MVMTMEFIDGSDIELKPPTRNFMWAEGYRKGVVDSVNYICYYESLGYSPVEIADILKEFCAADLKTWVHTNPKPYYPVKIPKGWVPKWLLEKNKKENT